MDAEPLSIGRVLSEQQRFIVPIYQRTYSWTQKKQLDPFFEQIKDKAAHRLEGQRTSFSHYMGALLVIPDGEAVFGKVQTYYVVDGQQRLTTFHLFYAALRDVARVYEYKNIEKQLAALLLHPDDLPLQDPNQERYKLQPTTYDRALYRDLINLSWEEIRTRNSTHFYKNGSIRTAAQGVPLPLLAYWYFWDQAEAFITDYEELDSEIEDNAEEIERRLLALSQALYEDFRLIVITLSHDDDAQVIFETLNSAGEPLAAMDLVRNDVFHRANRREEDVETLMSEQWSLFENDFWKQTQTQGRIKKPRIDFYLGHVLAAELGDEISLSELYAEYKRFIVEKRFPNSQDELTALTHYAPIYKILVAPQGDEPLAKLARRLSIFDVGTAFPLVFVVAGSKADDAIKERLYELIASYVFRRALCGLTPKNYNRNFIKLAIALKHDGVSEDSLSSELATMEGDATRFPSDDELQKAIINKTIYGTIPSGRLRLLLSELELSSRDKFDEAEGIVADLSVEHILPDSWHKNWPLPDERSVPKNGLPIDETMSIQMDARDTAKHTLGNLTLLTQPANSSLTNSSFQDKKIRLKKSLLKMNQEIAEHDAWDETTIRARGEQLAKMALTLWPCPLVESAED